MAPATKAEEMNYFALMGLTSSATEAEIRKAHKKLSLALHPDKNRDGDPVETAARFSEMQLAYEVLMDPSARLAAAERNKADTARKERRGAYEGKRKAMAEELERREGEEREKRFKGVQVERRRSETLQRLREEGRRLREERERKMHEATQVRMQQDAEVVCVGEDQSARVRQGLPHQSSSETPEPELGPLDLTVKLRFPSDLHDQLSDPPRGSNSKLDAPLAKALTVRFGKLDSIIFRTPKQGKSEATAHATFKTLDAAYAAVKAGSTLQAGGEGEARYLDDVWINWAAAAKGKTGEPARIAWMRKRNKLASSEPALSRDPRGFDMEADLLSRLRGNGSTEAAGKSQVRPVERKDTSFSNFSFAMPDVKTPSSESDILQRMRLAERERVEEAIALAEQ